MATYRQQRNYENLNKAMFDGEGQYDIPALAPAECDVENWISFNFAKGCEEPERHGVHFFIDDYQFNRVWTSPGCVCRNVRTISGSMYARLLHIYRLPESHSDIQPLPQALAGCILAGARYDCYTYNLMERPRQL